MKAAKPIPRCECGIRLIKEYVDFGTCAKCTSTPDRERKLQREIDALKAKHASEISVLRTEIKAAKITAEFDENTRARMLSMAETVRNNAETISRLRSTVDKLNDDVRVKDLCLKSLADTNRDTLASLSKCMIRDTIFNENVRFYDKLSFKACIRGDTCSICTEIILPREPVKSLQCKHNFHNVCLYRLFITSECGDPIDDPNNEDEVIPDIKCPLCRSQIVELVTPDKLQDEAYMTEELLTEYREANGL